MDVGDHLVDLSSYIRNCISVGAYGAGLDVSMNRADQLQQAKQLIAVMSVLTWPDGSVKGAASIQDFNRMRLQLRLIVNTLRPAE